MNHNKTKDRMSAVEKALAPVMEKMAQTPDAQTKDSMTQAHESKPIKLAGLFDDILGGLRNFMGMGDPNYRDAAVQMEKATTFLTEGMNSVYKAISFLPKELQQTQMQQANAFADQTHKALQQYMQAKFVRQQPEQVPTQQQQAQPTQQPAIPQIAPNTDGTPGQARAASMDYEAWVKQNCKFAQAVPQPAPMGGQMAGGGMESIVRELAQQLAQRSTMAPISQMDVRQGIMKMMQSKGLAMPQGGDLEGFVGSVMDAIQGMGGQVAQVQQDQPQAAATPFDARPNREKAPMDPDMSSWYNNSRMSRQPSGGMGQR